MRRRVVRGRSRKGAGGETEEGGITYLKNSNAKPKDVMLSFPPTWPFVITRERNTESASGVAAEGVSPDFIILSL